MMMHPVSFGSSRRRTLPPANSVRPPVEGPTPSPQAGSSKKGRRIFAGALAAIAAVAGFQVVTNDKEPVKEELQTQVVQDSNDKTLKEAKSDSIFRQETPRLSELIMSLNSGSVAGSLKVEPYADSSPHSEDAEPKTYRFTLDGKPYELKYRSEYHEGISTDYISKLTLPTSEVIEITVSGSHFGPEQRHYLSVDGAKIEADEYKSPDAYDAIEGLDKLLMEIRAEADKAGQKG